MSNTAHVISATITLTIKKPQDKYSNSFELTAYPLKTPWTESGVTWNTSDGVTPWDAGFTDSSDRGALAGAITVPGPASSDKFQIIINLNDAGIAYVQDCINNPSTNFGFVFDNEENKERRYCYLRETDIVSERPKITLNYMLETPNPPDNPSVIINNGDLQTTNNVVSLNLFADNPIPIDMQISESSNFTGAAWMDYQTNYPWTFNLMFETKTIYARFSDGGVGISETASDSIDIIPEPWIGIWMIALFGALLRWLDCWSPF